MVRDSSVTRGVEQSQRAPGGGADHWVTWVCVVLGADHLLTVAVNSSRLRAKCLLSRCGYSRPQE